MDGSDLAQVLVERIGHVMVVRLNRPEKRNALTRAMSERLVAALEEAEADPEIRVGVLASAAPGMFCAGADLGEISSGVLTGERRGLRKGFHLVERRKPWIAAVGGVVLGGGFELALACDLMVAAEGTVLGLPEVQRGLIAGSGGAIWLPKRLPRALATEMLLTGSRLPAERALALGLLNRLTPEDGLFAAAMELAEAVAACAPMAVQETLSLARLAPALTEDALWPVVGEALGRVFASDDCREGMAAYAGKRAPVWSGR
jgi:enoyl-CoA hydratase/carnithine racemase